LFALCDISVGEEITYDYRFASFGAMQTCSCGAENCRGFIGLNKKDDSMKPMVEKKKPQFTSQKQPQELLSSGMKSKSKRIYYEIPSYNPKPKVKKNNRKKTKEDDGPTTEVLVWTKNKSMRIPLRIETLQRSLPRNIRSYSKKYQNTFYTKSLDKIIEDLHQEVGEDTISETVTVTVNGSFRIGAIDPLGDAQKFIQNCWFNSIRPKHFLIRNIIKTGRVGAIFDLVRKGAEIAKENVDYHNTIQEVQNDITNDLTVNAEIIGDDVEVDEDDEENVFEKPLSDADCPNLGKGHRRSRGQSVDPECPSGKKQKTKAVENTMRLSSGMKSSPRLPVGGDHGRKPLQVKINMASLDMVDTVATGGSSLHDVTNLIEYEDNKN
jgi:hypothetical protein